MRGKIRSFVGGLMGGDSILQPKQEADPNVSSRHVVIDLLDTSQISEHWRKGHEELHQLFLDASQDWASSSSIRYREMRRRYKTYKHKSLPRRILSQIRRGGRPMKPAEELSREECLELHLQELSRYRRWLLEIPVADYGISERKQNRIHNKCVHLLEDLEIILMH